MVILKAFKYDFLGFHFQPRKTTRTYIILIRKRWQSYRCESGIAKLSWRVSWNYAYNSFKIDKKFNLPWLLKVVFKYIFFSKISSFMNHVIHWNKIKAKKCKTWKKLFAFFLFSVFRYSLFSYVLAVRIVQGIKTAASKILCVFKDCNISFQIVHSVIITHFFLNLK